MTDTQASALSLAIARFMEPEPVWEHPKKSREYLGTFYSTERWWQKRFEFGTERPAEPRSHREPEVSMSLLKELSLDVWADANDVWRSGQAVYNGTVRMLVNMAQTDNPEDAIALAAAKALGVEWE